MSATFKRKTFKAGDGIGIRLPKSFGIVDGDDVEIERTPYGVIIRKKSKTSAAMPR